MRTGSFAAMFSSILPGNIKYISYICGVTLSDNDANMENIYRFSKQKSVYIHINNNY